MRHFWQWFCGYVCVCMKGRQVNRFLNLCSRNGIHLWRIAYDVEQNLRANIRLHDFYDLKPYLRKTKTKIKILSKKGFPFWCHRHPRLKWFFCITFFLLCFGFYSLNFVWNIEVKGNSKVSTQDILECLDENEIKIGLKQETIDCSKIELLLREQFHQLGWVSVYLEHTNLCIEVKESLYDVIGHSEDVSGRMFHLIANKEGRISSIVTRAGKALVKEGQIVKPGDILVLGQSEIFDDNGEVKETLYLKADASIYADVMYHMDIPLTEMELAALKLAGKHEESLLLGLGYQKLMHVIEQMQNVQILDKTLTIEKDEKKMIFRAKLYVREQIGINIPAEEVWENEFE